MAHHLIFCCTGPIIAAAINAETGAFSPAIIAPARNGLRRQTSAVLAAFPPAVFGRCAEVLVAVSESDLLLGLFDKRLPMAEDHLPLAIDVALLYHAPVIRFAVRQLVRVEMPLGTSPSVEAAAIIGGALETLFSGAVTRTDHAHAKRKESEGHPPRRRSRGVIPHAPARLTN